MPFRDLQYTLDSLFTVLAERYPEMRVFYHNDIWTIRRNGAVHRGDNLREVLEEALHGALYA